MFNQLYFLYRTVIKLSDLYNTIAYNIIETIDESPIS